MKHYECEACGHSWQAENPPVGSACENCNTGPENVRVSEARDGDRSQPGMRPMLRAPVKKAVVGKAGTVKKPTRKTAAKKRG